MSQLVMNQLCAVILNFIKMWFVTMTLKRWPLNCKLQDLYIGLPAPHQFSASHEIPFQSSVAHNLGTNTGYFFSGISNTLELC